MWWLVLRVSKPLSLPAQTVGMKQDLLERDEGKESLNYFGHKQIHEIGVIQRCWRRQTRSLWGCSLSPMKHWGNWRAHSREGSGESLLLPSYSYGHLVKGERRHGGRQSSKVHVHKTRGNRQVETWEIPASGGRIHHWKTQYFEKNFHYEQLSTEAVSCHSMSVQAQLDTSLSTFIMSDYKTSRAPLQLKLGL